jgi:signal transduction histidine kinase
MKKTWEFIINTGVHYELPPDEKKAVRLVNKLCVFLLVLAVLSIIINIILGSLFFITALSTAILLLGLTFFLNHKKLYTAAKVNTILVLTGLLLFMSLKGGYGSGLEYYFLSLLALPFFLFRNKKLIYFFQVLFMASLLIQKFCSAGTPVDTASVPHLVFYVFNSLGSVILIIIAIVSFKDLTLKNEKELYRKTQIIEENNRELKATNKQLDFFTYSVSHDLKAPLRSIGGYSELLGKEPRSRFSDEDSLYIEGIKTNAKRMKNLIDNLLTYSHSNKKQLSIKQTDLSKIVKEVLEDHKEEVKKYGTRVILDPLPLVKADPDLMRHVLENLISNALKYSQNKAEPKIEIGSFFDGPDPVYFVKDNGEGFNMKEAGKLFTPFHRLHSVSEFEGSGIGLSIVKNIILKHGGKVWAEGKEGEGAVFCFSFPVNEVKLS